MLGYRTKPVEAKGNFEFSSSAGGGSPKGDPHLRGLGRSPKASPRRCVKIRDFANNFEPTPSRMRSRASSNSAEAQRRKSLRSRINLEFRLAISMKSTHAVAPATFSRAAPRHRVRILKTNRKQQNTPAIWAGSAVFSLASCIQFAKPAPSFRTNSLCVFAIWAGIVNQKNHVLSGAWLNFAFCV